MLKILQKVLFAVVAVMAVGVGSGVTFAQNVEMVTSTDADSKIDLVNGHCVCDAEGIYSSDVFTVSPFANLDTKTYDRVHVAIRVDDLASLIDVNAKKSVSERKSVLAGVNKAKFCFYSNWGHGEKPDFEIEENVKKFNQKNLFEWYVKSTNEQRVYVVEICNEKGARIGSFALVVPAIAPVNSKAIPAG